MSSAARFWIKKKKKYSSSPPFVVLSNRFVRDRRGFRFANNPQCGYSIICRVEFLAGSLPFYKQYRVGVNSPVFIFFFYILYFFLVSKSPLSRHPNNRGPLSIATSVLACTNLLLLLIRRCRGFRHKDFRIDYQ